MLRIPANFPGLRNSAKNKARNPFFFICRSPWRIDEELFQQHFFQGDFSEKSSNDWNSLFPSRSSGFPGGYSNTWATPHCGFSLCCGDIAWLEGLQRFGTNILQYNFLITSQPPSPHIPVQIAARLEEMPTEKWESVRFPLKCSSSVRSPWCPGEKHLPSWADKHQKPWEGGAN